MRVPNFIVVGAHKGGTTSLHYYLEQHPNVYLPEQKGSDLLARRNFETLADAGEYLDQFKAASDEQLLGEVSSVYLHRGEWLVKRIHTLFPDVQIIASLRNPAERAYSNALYHRPYTQEELDNLESMIFETEQFLNPGRYYTHLKTYFEYFDPKQIKLFLFDSLQKNALQFVQELYDFVGIDPTFTPDLSQKYNVGALKIDNPSRQLLQTGFSVSSSLRSLVPKPIRNFIREKLDSQTNFKKPSMSPELRARLIDYYYEEIVGLQQLTGLDCSAWLEKK